MAAEGPHYLESMLHVSECIAEIDVCVCAGECIAELPESQRTYRYGC